MASAQLHTVPVYIVACVFVVLAAWLADKYARAPVILFFLAVAVLGWSLARILDDANIHGRYTAMFLAAIGSYSAFPVVVVSLTCNVGGRTKRATEIGMQVGFGGLSGAITPWLFRARDAPGYKFGCQWNIILGLISISFTALNWLLLSFENRKKQQAIKSIEDRLIEQIDEVELRKLGDASPYFMYTY